MSEDQDDVIEFLIETMSQGRCLEDGNDALKECVGHCRNNPLLSKARVLTIQIEVVPVANKEGSTFRGVNTKYKVSTKMPSVRGDTDCALMIGGTLKVSATDHESALHPNQMSFAEVRAKKEIQ